MRVYACSSNAGKLSDFRLVASELGFTNFTLEQLPGLADIKSPEETGDTFEENATEKALYYSQFTSEAVLADDSGLEVDGLGGAPGVYSARYAGAGATDEANNQLLLRNMAGMANRKAKFVCAIAIAQQRQTQHVLRGVVEGEILTSARGTGGFGYDPLFYYPPFACSFGELDSARKFGVSHRGAALRRVVEWMAVSEPQQS